MERCKAFPLINNDVLTEDLQATQKIFNQNKMKICYGHMKNMSIIVKRHIKNVSLKSNDQNSPCNCYVKTKFTMEEIIVSSNKLWKPIS